MYWLRWHYHVKDIPGAPYKIKKKEKKEKQNNRIADSQLRVNVKKGLMSWSQKHCQSSLNISLWQM